MAPALITENNAKPYSLLNRLSCTIVVIWVCIILGSLLWNRHMVRHQAETIALNVASAYFDKDLAFRLWGARHGGVYVPASKDSPPNPYLSHIPERDIVTPSGKQLTLINPAYMIRQMMSDFSTLTEVSGHLTSLNLLNPINKPDPWEEKILRAFDQGSREATAFIVVDGKPILRLMRPFITKESCLKCHAQQGYEVGDVRGGTSISIPMEPYLAMEATVRQGMLLTHLFILVFGLLGIALGYWRIKKNITRHVVLEEELKSQNKFTHSIIESLTHPFLVFDANSYKVELANSTALQGAPLENQTCYTMCHNLQEPCSGDEHPCPINILKETKKSVTLEHVHYDAQGDKKDVEIQCYPLIDEKGEVSKIIEYAIDITERRNAEKESERLKGQLLQAQKMEAIGQLSGGVAHDFNNLLTAILGYSELAANRLDSTHPVQKYLRIVHETGQKATALTRQLLAFSRKQVLDIHLICLDSLILDMTKMLSRLLGDDVQVQHKLNAGGLAIKADPVQLEQVVMNLAVNARDAMPDGGILTFATEKVSLESETVSSMHAEMQAGEYIQLSVSDNGDGMSEETRKKLFEPFFTTKETGKGTGLGLATVYGIVTQHNSFITVHSETGVGTTFTIYFPLATEDASEIVPKKRTTDSKPTGDENILVLDDDKTIVDFMTATLTNFGYTVVSMYTPGDALEYMRDHPVEIDLLLTDVIMPGMNGKELEKKVREFQPQIRVLFMSGYTDDIIARQGVLNEGVQFVQKPATPSLLATKVREALDQDSC